jgi:uncharacterized 2Fe-2S/4Fe-4S cluster protein (DUF4445 family)
MTRIDFEPIGQRLPCETGVTILDASRAQGILLNATCGGDGLCGRCGVQVMQGKVSPPTRVELEEFDPEHIQQGWRLACQARVLGDMRVHSPPESLATLQRMQVEGVGQPVEPAPAVRMVEAVVEPASIHDLRSDAARLRDALGMPGLEFPLPVLQSLPDALRSNHYQLSVVVRGSSVIACHPAGKTPLGLAVDLGTTKLAAYLLDLSSGATLQSGGAMNPQIAFGEDVMSRLNHAMTEPQGGKKLQEVVVEAINGLAADLCAREGRSAVEIADAAVVGNTAMHHLFLGLPVRQLGLAPYVPAESAALDIPAVQVGLQICPGAFIHLLPNIAGFVGADHVSMLLGSGMLDRQGVVLGLDIGTNTEISLLTNGHHYSCSTASGPAFEGAHIRHGMRAADGAIERVLIRDGKARLQVIGGQPALGLCGSGILDLVAQLRREKIIDPRGSFPTGKEDSHVRKGEDGREFVLLTSTENNGREITFSRKDINEIQLAKGAMRAGQEILLKKAGLRAGDVETVIIAGAFGTYLDVQSGIDIGMFPPIPRERFIQVGNAAGTGARMALLSTRVRQQAVDVARNVQYVELTAEKDFSSIFARSLLLE